MSYRATCLAAHLALAVATAVAASPSAHASELTTRRSVLGERFASGRVGFHLNLGSGLSVGHLGGTISVDLVPAVFLEAGAGVSFRGLQASAGVGGRIPIEHGLTLNVAAQYSYDRGLRMVIHDAPEASTPAHWVTPTLQIEGRGQNGFVVRGEVGAGVQLAGDGRDVGQIVLAIGVTVGFWL